MASNFLIRITGNINSITVGLSHLYVVDDMLKYFKTCILWDERVASQYEFVVDSVFRGDVVSVVDFVDIEE